MRGLVAAVVLSFASGCATETMDPDAEEELDDIADSESAVQSQNALTPNGLMPNGLMPNGLAASSLTPGTISYASRRALQDSSRTGQLSRLFLRYAVSCAFDNKQSYTIKWRDRSGSVRVETYRGSIGLAPEWQSGPLNKLKQSWVSACMAARTNYFGVTVLISARGNVAALAADASERSEFRHMEGAFWGNLFAPMPYLRACYDGKNRDYSRSKARVCAAGYDNGTTTVGCGAIKIAGECSTMCARASDPDMGFSACDGTTQVITTFLD